MLLLERHILEGELYSYTVGNHFVPLLGQINSTMKMVLKGINQDVLE